MTELEEALVEWRGLDQLRQEYPAYILWEAFNSADRLRKQSAHEELRAMEKDAALCAGGLRLAALLLIAAAGSEDVHQVDGLKSAHKDLRDCQARLVGRANDVAKLQAEVKRLQELQGNLTKVIAEVDQEVVDLKASLEVSAGLNQNLHRDISNLRVDNEKLFKENVGLAQRDRANGWERFDRLQEEVDAYRAGEVAELVLQREEISSLDKEAVELRSALALSEDANGALLESLAEMTSARNRFRVALAMKKDSDNDNDNDRSWLDEHRGR